MTIPTQAQVMRAVKAALEPARKMGLHVTGYKVTFVQGVPAVDVTLAGESAQPSPINLGENAHADCARAGLVAGRRGGHGGGLYSG